MTVFGCCDCEIRISLSVRSTLGWNYNVANMGVQNNMYSYILKKPLFRRHTQTHPLFIYWWWMNYWIGFLKTLIETICSMNRLVVWFIFPNAPTVRSPLAADHGSFYWTLWLDFAVPALQKRWQKPWKAWNSFRLIRNTKSLDDLLKIPSCLSL